MLLKDEAIPLPNQISNIIREKIQCGEYKPGKKLDTIRKYAKDFSVSPVTVIKAFDILEEETLIERIPVKGVFVSDSLKNQTKQITGCFAFPEKSLFSTPSTNENWGLTYELYRGVFEAAQEKKINMQFIYFENTNDKQILEKQKAALRKFDFVIFPGDGQLMELCQSSALERPTYCLASGRIIQDSKAITIDYNREDVIDYLLGYLKESNCLSVGAISSYKSSKNRAKKFLTAAKAANYQVDEHAELITYVNDEDVNEKIKNYLLEKRRDFIFVDHTEVMMNIYEIAYNLGFTIGKDLILTSIASGVSFVGLFPRLSYFRIPRYEMGLKIMESAEKLVRNNKIFENFTPAKLEFVKGHVFKKQN